MEWRPPKKDGGTPVTTYIIEKRLKGSPLWDEAARVAGECTKTKITDVQEGEEYEFRLIAINKAGPSEPSDPTQPITAKPRFCKHDFKLSFYRLSYINCHRNILKELKYIKKNIK